MIDLQLIKPKTLPDDKYAYLSGSSCVLDFGTCKILMPHCNGMNYQPAYITIKDLFNMELESAVSVDTIGHRTFVPDLDWNTIPVNLVDAGVFNAVASAGDAIFWHSNFTISKKSWSLKAAGFIYYLESSMPKILDWVPESGLDLYLDHNAFFYIYQMFKDVKKTKPKVMKIAWDKEFYYIKDDVEDFPYVIIIPRSHSEFTEKQKSFDKISKAYDKGENGRYSTIDRVSFAKDKHSLVKHLLKAVGDAPKHLEVSTGDKYQSDTVELWINKKKPQKK